MKQSKYKKLNKVTVYNVDLEGVIRLIDKEDKITIITETENTQLNENYTYNISYNFISIAISTGEEEIENKIFRENMCLDYIERDLDVLSGKSYVTYIFTKGDR